MSDFRLTREWFEQRACPQDGCDHHGEQVGLRANCHPDSPLVARYSFALGALALACGACGAGVADVAVAGQGGALAVKPTATPTAPPVVQEMTQRARANRVRKAPPQTVRSRR